MSLLEGSVDELVDLATTLRAFVEVVVLLGLAGLGNILRCSLTTWHMVYIQHAKVNITMYDD